MRALLIVDMQNDFMPKGPLAVPNADRTVSLINSLMPKFSLVIATQDCHPADHVSFAQNHPGRKPGEMIKVRGIEQILWPVHCVQKTLGAELTKDLDRSRIETIFYKGTDKWIDSYSAFFDNARKRSTGLFDFLKLKGVTELFVCGVATDYCVLYSVIDALDLGLSVTVITDACSGIDLSPGDVDAAYATMSEKGAHLVTSKALF
ncbi:MAG: bifunctional nicotinamidase/pyrazinamidase [Chlamydiales bacterium]|nr:bifunctional nicotinamidase/pyrazinamidase [Chlamydiales bacterium]